MSGGWWMTFALCRFSDKCGFNCSRSCCESLDRTDVNSNLTTKNDDNFAFGDKRALVFEKVVERDLRKDNRGFVQEDDTGDDEDLPNESVSWNDSEHIGSCLKTSDARRRSSTGRVCFADFFGFELTQTLCDSSKADRKKPRLPKIISDDLRGQWHLKNLFTLPSQEELIEKVNREKVCLEHVVVAGVVVMGTIRVANIGYRKSVIVRKTQNGWKSYVDVPATYLLNAYDGTTDRFSFAILDNNPTCSSHEFHIEFAIGYTVNGVTYWDNNGKENYSFICYTT